MTYRLTLKDKFNLWLYLGDGYFLYRYARCIAAQGLMRALLWAMLISFAGYAVQEMNFCNEHQCLRPW